MMGGVYDALKLLTFEHIADDNEGPVQRVYSGDRDIGEVAAWQELFVPVCRDGSELSPRNSFDDACRALIDDDKAGQEELAKRRMAVDGRLNPGGEYVLLVSEDGDWLPVSSGYEDDVRKMARSGLYRGQETAVVSSRIASD